jgi:hypothetical protein
MVVVARIVLDGDDDRAVIDESRDIVDMPVRVVTDAALAQPDRVANAQPVSKDLLVVTAPESNVSYLLVGEQPFLGDED